MPDKLSVILNNTPWVGGFIMAAVISALRVIYEKEETTFIRVVLESLICGFLTVAVGSLLDAMGFGQNWYLGAGGIIGFMGSQSVRAMANKYFSSKVKK